MMSFARSLPTLVIGATMLAGCVAPSATVASAPPPVSPFRIVEPGARREVTLEQMVAAIARERVIFFGEQHDDPGTHAAELALLEALGRSGRPVVLSLEMFERDVQPALDGYLAGRVSEADFLERSRPWPRYATDYRALVELAKARGWPVIAANVPRPIASAVGRGGLGVLDTLSGNSRRWAAIDLSCPPDDYRARFLAEMRSHSAGSGSAPQPGDTLPTAVAERFYLAQCLKDETMAESVVEAMRRAPRGTTLVHFNGAFHSDYGQGVVERVRRRQPRWEVALITAIPASDPAMAPVAPYTGRADFLVFTRKPE